MSETIMIVEDEGIVALELEECLQQMGYTVPAVVASGAEAVAKAAEVKPDLVLMDIRLKGEMDGIQAAQKIMAEQGIPVVYLTAYSDDTTVRRATETSPFGFVLKPWEERSLQIAINMALHKADVESTMRHQRDWYVSILRYMGAPLIVCDAQGVLRFMNSAAEQLLGTGLPTGKASLYDVLGRADPNADSPLSAIDAVLEGRTVRIRNVHLRRAGEQETAVDLTVTPMRGESPEDVEGFAVLMQPRTGDEEAAPTAGTPLPEYLQLELTRLMLLGEAGGGKEDPFRAGQLDAYRRILRDHLGVTGFESPRNGWRSKIARSAIRDAHEQVKAVWKAQHNVTETGTVTRERFSRYLAVLAQRLVDSRGKKRKKHAVNVEIHAEEIELDPAISCALLVDELLRYVLKREVEQETPGALAIRLEVPDGQTLRLVITHGALKTADLPTDEETSSVLDVLTGELGGTMTTDQSRGATWSVLFPRVRPT